ncbi:MAG: hypothetical protein M3198_08530 [Actinomycetota bacterium]|nr:hypothetical protein [Actinomycetota bacterium]
MGFVAAGGVNRTLLREIPADLARERFSALLVKKAYSLSVLQISMPSVALITFAVALAIGQGSHHALLVAATTALLVSANAVQSVAGDSLRAFGDVRFASFVEGRSGGAAVLMVFALLLLPFISRSISLGAALLVNLVAYGFVLIPAARRLAAYWRRIAGRAAASCNSAVAESASAKRSFLTTSAIFVGTQLITMLASQVDLWLGGTILGPREISLFAAATRVMMLVSMPLVAMQFTLAPIIAALYAAGETKRLRHRVKTASAVVGLPSFAALILLAAVPGDVLSLVFGSSYAGGSEALLWLAFGQAVNAATGLCGLVLAMTRFERDVLMVGSIITALKVGLGIPAAMQYEVVGLAAVSGITTALLFGILLLLARVRLGFWTTPRLPRLRGSFAS